MAVTAQVTYRPEDMQLVPSSYQGQIGYEGQHNQMIAYNTAQVKSKYEDLMGISLTHNDNKRELSDFMEKANKELRSTVGIDMSIGDNQQKALGIFKPLYDGSNQASQDIWGDHQLTDAVNKANTLYETSKFKDDGKAYNAVGQELNNNILAFYSMSGKDAWRSLSNALPGYKAYYDTEAEDRELIKNFKPDHVDLTQATGQGNLSKYENSSSTAKQIKEYLEANHSERYKEQKALEAKSNLSRMMLSSINPQTKEYDPTHLINSYTNLFEGIKLAKKQEIGENLNMLYTELALVPPTVEGRQLKNKLQSTIDNYTLEYNSLDEQKFDSSNLKSIQSFSKAANDISSLEYELSNIKKANAAKRTDVKIDNTAPDQVYWNRADNAIKQANLQLQRDEFSYRKEHDALKDQQDFDKFKAELDFKYKQETGKNLRWLGKNPLLGEDEKGILKSVATPGTVTPTIADLGLSTLENLVKENTNELTTISLDVLSIASPGSKEKMDVQDYFSNLEKKGTNHTWGELVNSSEGRSDFAYITNLAKGLLHDINQPELHFGISRYKSIEEVPYEQVKSALLQSMSNPAKATQLIRSSTVVNKEEVNAKLQSILNGRTNLQNVVKNAIDEIPELKGLNLSLEDVLNEDVLENKIKTLNKGKVITEGRYKGQKIIDVDKNTVLISDGFAIHGIPRKEISSVKDFIFPDIVKKQIGEKLHLAFPQFASVGKQEISKTPSATVPVYKKDTGEVVNKEQLKQWQNHGKSVQNTIDQLREQGGAEDSYLDLVYNNSEAFIQIDDENGTRFEPNNDYINNVLPEQQRANLLDQASTLGEYDHTGWFSDVFSKNKIDNTEELKDATEGGKLASRTFKIQGRDYEQYKPHTKEASKFYSNSLIYENELSTGIVKVAVTPAGSDVDVAGGWQSLLIQNGKVVLNNAGEPITFGINAFDYAKNKGLASSSTAPLKASTWHTAMVNEASRQSQLFNYINKYKAGALDNQGNVILKLVAENAIRDNNQVAYNLILDSIK